MDGLLRPIVWMGSSRLDLAAMPDDVKDDIGYALYVAQLGGASASAKQLKGFGGAGVFEIVARNEGGAYRAVYAVKLKHALYVLHCFQKKSRRGAQTPKPDIDLIKSRLKMAEAVDSEQP